MAAVGMSNSGVDPWLRPCCVAPRHGLLAYIVYCLWYAKKYNIPKGKKSTGREKWAATKDAAWALGVPVIIMGGIYSG